MSYRDMKRLSLAEWVEASAVADVILALKREQAKGKT